MSVVYVVAAGVAYFFMSVFTCFYLSKVAVARRWHRDDTAGAQVAGFLIWPVVWLVMLAWLISTKVRVP